MVQHWKATWVFATVLAPRAENPVPSDFSGIMPLGKEDLVPPLSEDSATGISHTKHAMGTSASAGACFDGIMNCLMQFMQRTWPHFMAMAGLDALESAFRHEGQVLRLSWPEEPLSSLKWIVIRCCKDRGWRLSSDEAGHDATCFVFLLEGRSLLSLATSGVRDGVQKDGREGLLACNSSLVSP